MFYNKDMRKKIYLYLLYIFLPIYQSQCDLINITNKTSILDFIQEKKKDLNTILFYKNHILDILNMIKSIKYKELYSLPKKYTCYNKGIFSQNFGMFIDHKRKIVFIAQYGTSFKIRDVIDDIQIYMRNKSVKMNIPEEDTLLFINLNKVRNYYFIFVGHSLGGSKSIELNQFCKKIFNIKKSYNITFESPGYHILNKQIYNTININLYKNRINQFNTKIKNINIHDTYLSFGYNMIYYHRIKNFYKEIQLL